MSAAAKRKRVKIMATNYFNNASTLQELKRQYRDLVKEHHPDIGGQTATMKAINAEYKRLFESVSKTKEEEQSGEVADDLVDILNQVVSCPGLEIEIIGRWIWISGDTKPVKEKLKSIGFRWAPKKTAWYWHKGAFRKQSKKRFQMDDLRDIYGSVKVDDDETRAAIS